MEHLSRKDSVIAGRAIRPAWKGKYFHFSVPSVNSGRPEVSLFFCDGVSDNLGIPAAAAFIRDANSIRGRACRIERRDSFIDSAV